MCYNVRRAQGFRQLSAKKAEILKEGKIGAISNTKLKNPTHLFSPPRHMNAHYLTTWNYAPFLVALHNYWPAMHAHYRICLARLALAVLVQC